MNARSFIAIVSSLLGMLLPSAFVWMKLGPDARLSEGADPTKQVILLLGGFLLSFLFGLVAASALKGANTSLNDIAKDILRNHRRRLRKA